MSKHLVFLLLSIIIGSEGLSQSTESKVIAKDAKVRLIDASFSFTEGPAVDHLGNVYFTDQPNNRILKWSAGDNRIDVFMENVGRSNGLFFDHQGNLLACADENNQLWKIGPDKKIEVLVTDYEGQRLNGPNDLWVDKKGGIYFTDPFYQRKWWSHSEKEIEEERVYYLAPNGSIEVAATGFKRPNGIVGTKNGKKLYVADIGNKTTYVFSVAKDGSLRDRKLFANMGSDGMTVDHKGNVYLTGNGVTVFNRRGKKIGEIPIDQRWTANVVFGGPAQRTLFVTAMGAVYTLEMSVHGVR